MSEPLTIKVACVAPQGMGKTSLLVSVLQQGQDTLRGERFSLKAAGPSQAALNRIKNMILGAIDAGHFKFDQGVVRAGVDKVEFSLLLEAASQGVRFDFLDFPGGWLDPELRRDQKKWDECLEFIRESSVMLLPVDAAIVMEASSHAEKVMVRELLSYSSVDEVVCQDWAKGLDPNLPALLIIVPIKCEKYFDRNQHDLLFSRVSEIYGPLVDRVRQENAAVKCLYAPVETFGVVELEDCRYDRDGSGRAKFQAEYVVKRKTTSIKQQLKGWSPRYCDAVLGAICEHFLLSVAHSAREREAAAQGRFSKAEAEVNKSRPFYEEWWDWWADNDKKRRVESEKARHHLGEATEDRRSILGALEKFRKVALPEPHRVL
jgi:hypothetical protein